ncbi:hypothetical protein CONLIGDRAFT_7203 [Coniochaeta ligniaria NRRL 30616]|uniref:Uncharacterized protein n=1 Tax=Coniochaeta ligniaria NRRL 30616 TaxID=1408157 RepID=A0A1J7JWP3_9PEZI|nr:hypothetical protein CONLIGDRAFT_7203 [Coniochaeta ligniaria NRRL 30616]
MGASLSTLGGWTIVLCIAGYYAFRYLDGGKKREIARAAAQQKKRLEDRYVPPNQKENKSKAKRQRGESNAKEIEKSDKSSKSKQRPAAQQPLATATNQKPEYSSDDGVDNREFAKQLASIKQGTSFTGPKKGEEKKAKSVKQSRAQETETAPQAPAKVSAPSSTTGADADDDQSPIASPEFTAVDSRDVSDMLEQPTSSGPSVLRLTDTNKSVKPNTKKVKAPETKETKKQRQNKQKAEAARLAREAEEADRKVKMEQQRRTARIAEGRAAKDGSSFTNVAAPKNNAWAANGVNGASGASGLASSEFVPVQPLDTFDTANQTDASKASAPSVGKSSDNWVSSLPSEEEQLSLLQDEDNWNTVTSKKARRKTKEHITSDSNSVSNDTSSVTSSVHKPQKVAPVTQQPVVTASQTKPQDTRVNGRPSTFAQQSSFAALSNDTEEQEQEWDV